MKRHMLHVAATALCLLGGSTPAMSQASANDRTQDNGTAQPGGEHRLPADPYPLTAAGWGPEAGDGRMASRWADVWTGLPAQGTPRAGKAVPLGGDAVLTFSTEARWRLDAIDNGRALAGNDFTQGLFRGVVGADVQANPNVRVFGEIGTGQVQGRRQAAGANFRNRASLQQLFVEYRRMTLRGLLVGAMVGRQEFADGPRQLVSLGDGPNLHRSWNGVRLYAHGDRVRLGLFDFRVTRLGAGGFDDETINARERLRGANASLIVSARNRPDTYFDPFWIRSSNDTFRAGGNVGPDRRDTVGARVWGRRGGLRFDWTAAAQTGESSGRPVEAWGLFAVQSLALSSRGWKPRLTSRIDLASGGGAYGSGTLRAFHPLYASSQYVGEGQFFGLSNVALATAGLSVAPTARSAIAMDYSLARRMRAGDAVYAGGMRPYAGTESLPGSDAGRLLRVTGSWAPSSHWTFGFDYERLVAGGLLRAAGFRSAGYAHLSATYRY